MSTPPSARLGTRVPFSSETILQHSFSEQTNQNPLQREVDSLVSGFVEQATDWKTLASLTAGGLAYRYGKIGVMGLGSSTVLRPLSVVVGLGSEVTAFEFTNRALAAVTGRAGLKSAPTDTLWLWNGNGGWKQSLISDLITFGILKSAGHLSRETNVVFQHSFASTAMVAGHQTSSLLGITSKPEGSMAEQFLHAEITNLQLAAGTSLVSSIAPGVYSLERGLDLSLKSEISPGYRTPQTLLSLLRIEDGLRLASLFQRGTRGDLVLAEGITDVRAIRESPLRDPQNNPHVLLMAAKDKNNPMGSLKGVLSFDRGALAIGGDKALQWLQSIREISRNEKQLFWIPKEFYEMVLLNEFDLVMSHDKKELVPLNIGEKISIKALPPLLKQGEIVRMSPHYREDIEKVLKRWNDRAKLKQEKLYDWDWLMKELEKLCATKKEVKEIRKENGKMYLFFQNGKKELLPPNVLIFPDPKNRGSRSPTEALSQFENQFWEISPQEMEKRTGPKALRKLPERTIISQFIAPGAIFLPDYGKPLQGIKGVKVYVFQHPDYWVSDFSKEAPTTVTSSVSPHILEYLKIIAEMPRPKTSPPPPPSDPSPMSQGIPQAIEEQNALPMVDSRPVPSPEKPPPAAGKPGKGRIETDPTMPLKTEDIKTALNEPSGLPFAKTSPEGEPIIPSPPNFQFSWGKRIYRAAQRLFTHLQIKWVEFRMERIFKAGQTPSTDQVLRLNHLREKNRFLGNPHKLLPPKEKE